jgi:DNA-binding MarR family transcriptional regulator
MVNQLQNSGNTPPQPDPAVQNVLKLVQELSLAWQRFQQEQADTVGLKRNNFLILRTVALAGQTGTTISKVGAALSVRPQGLSAAVAELSRHGLLRRETDERDQRNKRLKITEQGVELLKQCDQLNQDLVREISTQIPQSSIARLVVDRLVRSFKNTLP